MRKKMRFVVGGMDSHRYPYHGRKLFLEGDVMRAKPVDAAVIDALGIDLWGAPAGTLIEVTAKVVAVPVVRMEAVPELDDA